MRGALYRGEIHHSGFANTKAHEPLVDEATWRYAQERSPASWVVEVRDGKIAYWQTYTDHAQARRDIGFDG